MTTADHEFRLAQKYQQLCPQCLTVCAVTPEGELVDISAATVRIPIFERTDRPQPPNTTALKYGTVSVLLTHRCREEDLKAARQNPQADPSNIIKDVTEAEKRLESVHTRLRHQYKITEDDRAERKAAMAEYKAAMEEQRALLEQQALRQDCSQCGAQIDQPCLHLGRLKRGERVPVLHPHPVRMQHYTPVDPNPLLDTLERRTFERQNHIELAKASVAEAYRALELAERHLTSLESLNTSPQKA